MKSFVCILVFILIFGLSRGDDITLKDGTVYKNAKISDRTPSTVAIIHEGGVVRVLISSLPDALQKQLGYDPEAAAAYERQKLAAQEDAQKQEALEDMAKAIAKASVRGEGQIIQVLPDGILIRLYLPATNYGLGTVFVECNTAGLVDDQPWSGKVWKIGTYSYMDTLGATATIPKYTAIPESAVKALAGSSQ